MQQFDNASSGDIVFSLADRIIENRAYLSEIDGKIGDGDHGVNMAKDLAWQPNGSRAQTCRSQKLSTRSARC